MKKKGRDKMQEMYLGYIFNDLDETSEIKNSWTVYIYTFDDGKRYIGQTKQTVKKRKYSPYNQIVLPLIRSGRIVRTQICTGITTEEEAKELETKLILFFGTNDRQFGYNVKIDDYDGGKKVIAYNKRNKKPVLTFPSLQAAYRYMGGKSHSLIQKCIKGIKPSAYGYIWRFA